jgi:aspartate kinase
MNTAAIPNGVHDAVSIAPTQLRANNAKGGWVVQKFGGTSVGKFAVNIAEDIVRWVYRKFYQKNKHKTNWHRAGLPNNKIAVVCSARSTGKKVEGTTSRWVLPLHPLLRDPAHEPKADSVVHRLLEIFGVLKLVNTIKDVESVHYESLVNEYERLVRVICEDHISAAESHIQDENIRKRLQEEIKAECKEIIDYRLAAERWKLEIDSRSKDRIVSFGEKLSCRFVAALLQDRVSYADGIWKRFVDWFRASSQSLWTFPTLFLLRLRND